MKNRQLRLWICLGFLLAGCLWVVDDKLFAPQLSAQNGLLVCLGFAALFWITTSPTFFRKCVGEATPESLGAIRIITCTILLLMTLWITDIPSTALLPVEMRVSMGIINFFYAFPGFESFARSQTSLQIFEWFTALLLFLGIIGWQTRLVIPISAFCYLLLQGIWLHYSWFSHTGLLPLYVLVVLSLTPCADGLSVDRLWKVYRGQIVPPADRALPIYGWSRYACWVVIATSYVAAGLSKLRGGGLFWWDPTNVRFQLYKTALAPMQFDWSLVIHLNHAPDILFALMGMAGVYGEVAYGLVLFSKKARWILPIFMALMHISILLFQDILFLDLILLQLVFFDFTQIRKTIGMVLDKYFTHKRFKLSKGNSTHKIKPPEVSQPTIVAPVKDAFRYFYYPLIVSVFSTTLLICWFNRVEFYPFTTWAMFSGKHTSGVVTYQKLLAHYESGLTERAYPENIIPALFDTRYRKVIEKCFLGKPKAVLCDKFFKTIGSVYNKKARSGNKIAKFEIQNWQWNFRKHPSDPDYGNLVKRHITEVN